MLHSMLHCLYTTNNLSTFLWKNNCYFWIWTLIPFIFVLMLFLSSGLETLFLSCCKKTFSSEQHELEKLQNISFVALIFCIVFDMLLLPSRLYILFISFWETPFLWKQHELQNVQNISFISLIFCYFWLASAAPRAGEPVCFMVQSTILC